MIDITHYYSNEEIADLLQTWVSRYPALIRLETIGTSYLGTPIQIAILTNTLTGPDSEKPALWTDANIHATELCGVTIVLRFIESLLESYGKDPRLTRLLDDSVFYVLPRTNPDGAAWALAKNPCYIRSGVRPYPWQEKEDGLHEQDIDKDGRILQMRIPDPSGNWKISQADPRLMEARQPHEQNGQYYRLLSEGWIENYDGSLIPGAHPLQTLDFNRNFPFDWHPENDQQGAGPYPASEPEIRAVVDFIAKHPNINIAIAFHTFSRVILRPFSTRPDQEIPFADLMTYKKIGKVGTQLTTYPVVSIYHDFRLEPKEMTYGAFDDWMYDHMGAFAFTIEIWDLPTAAGIQNRKLIDWFVDHPLEEDVKILKWADENIPGGYVDWYSFDHPQLGKVELGGWNSLFTWTNPPGKFLAEEVERQVPFLLALGDMLPKLNIYRLDVEKLQLDTWKVNLVVENSGYLPTYTSEQAKKRKVLRPVRAELKLPAAAALKSGKLRQEIGHLEGRSNKWASFDTVSNPTDNRGRSEWVLQAPQGTEIDLKITSETRRNHS